MTGKILIKCDLVVRTGLHIGGSSSFSAIGTVDSPVIRDPFTGLPIVPGSSLKGKLRTLLARRSCVNGETLPDFSADGEVLLRMFGGSEPVRFARLQFADAFLLNYDQLKGVGVTEVKSENTINRLTSKANPRQIERVIAGARFGTLEETVAASQPNNALLSFAPHPVGNGLIRSAFQRRFLRILRLRRTRSRMNTSSRNTAIEQTMTVASFCSRLSSCG